ncbi:MAG: hypothetical protein GAK28_00612 [Luteibacter sp.]|uniref:hypothetical protein n=1 Tax=Luteibacter sp. TaxID=1886636 RepID=UPI001385FEB1|nr:hypothetical protein [Luteibacter sp.]KAF1008980.1 MAG: hypothetical protein GAK28_00612 [Luteibacter sp.]
MDLKEVRGCYDYHTGKAGDVGRQLALGGIAVVWLLHGDSRVLAFPKLLLIALGFFCGSLALDFLHYLSCSAIWGIYGRNKEKDLQGQGINPASPAAIFDAPPFINWTGLIFYWAKGMALIIGGVYLGIYLWARISAADV